MALSSGLDFLSLHPFVRAAAHEKALGCIFGGALGDCIGLYTGQYTKPALFTSLDLEGVTKYRG